MPFIPGRDGPEPPDLPEGTWFACPKPSAQPWHDVPYSEEGDCPLHEIPLEPVNEYGEQVA